MNEVSEYAWKKAVDTLRLNGYSQTDSERIADILLGADQLHFPADYCVAVKLADFEEAGMRLGVMSGDISQEQALSALSSTIINQILLDPHSECRENAMTMVLSTIASNVIHGIATGTDGGPDHD